jgi:hypothetical protein
MTQVEHQAGIASVAERICTMTEGSDPGGRFSHSTLLAWNAACTRTAAAVIVGILGLLPMGDVKADQPIAPPKCALSLSVEVTPDVPDPSNSEFISSLLGDHPGYRLFLLQAVDSTHVNLQLQGPGPDQRCQAVVNSMRNDGRVVSIQTK